MRPACPFTASDGVKYGVDRRVVEGPILFPVYQWTWLQIKRLMMSRIVYIFCLNIAIFREFVN